VRVLRLASVFQVPDSSLCAAAGWDAVGGMQTHTACLTRELDRLGLEQTVVTAWRPATPRREPIGRRSRVLRVGVPIHRVRQLYGVPAAVRAPGLAARADLVHAHLGEDLALAPVALAAARRARVPLVLTLHMSMRHTLGATNPRTWFLHHLGGVLETAAEHIAAAVLVLTPQMGDVLAAAGVAPWRIHVVPSGVDPDRFGETETDPLPGVRHPRITFVGRLAEQKEVSTLIAAAARMCSRPDLVLVGDGPERERVTAQVRAAGLASRTHMLGFRVPADVVAILRHSDVFVLPSRYEELGSALLEAMACGVPIAASRTGGIPYAVAGAGLLVEPRDPAALAAAVDRILGDHALAARLSRVGFERSRAFHWPRLARRVLGVYEDVLRVSPAR
jgi:glycosyltransferase involved in cell wall biosynthesis